MPLTATDLHVPTHPVRFVTAGSLFDGHDAAINIMRRLLQSQGAEVIHLGHDRSVEDVVTAAIQEDVQGVAVSSYQGGHVEYFTYLVERLRDRGAGHIRVYGGGGGVITPDEIATLHERGVARIFSPADGQHYGLPGMINLMIEACDVDLTGTGPQLDQLLAGEDGALGRTITMLECGHATDGLTDAIHRGAEARTVPVLGITGTGGSGKSSLTDEVVRRFRRDLQDKLRIAVLAIDPSKRRGGGALLGDRIRMNALQPGRVFFRSIATRGHGSEVPEHLGATIAACKAAGFDLVVVETPGIGQGDAAIVPYVDTSLYVMTPEFGAASQLEKIDMLDFADAVAVNKFERRGADDARRDVARQLVRNRQAFGTPWQDMPVFGTSAARFDDDGVTALYQELRAQFADHGLDATATTLTPVTTKVSTALSAVVPSDRERYLADIAETVRAYHRHTDEQREHTRLRQQLVAARAALADAVGGGDGAAAVPDGAAAVPDGASRHGTDVAGNSIEAAHIEPAHIEPAHIEPADIEPADDRTGVLAALDARIAALDDQIDTEAAALLASWAQTVEDYTGDEFVYTVRDDEFRVPLTRETLSGTRVPRVALPRLHDAGDLLGFLRRENLPGRFPFTGGVFPFKRDGEAPARMFAGEGDPFRTNRRFHYLAAGNEASRLSTAFDSVTLYGRDPDERPDIYGKVGTSGVSIATLDDMQALYDGFDLCAPTTSVSMTINGPAPAILAMFLNTAIDQQVELFRADEGREPDAAEAEAIRARALSSVRGTVQADILKEDQGQNTCIFSTEFALRCMADVQAWFIDHDVRNFYSVSISGYHIAEAGANPISQLAFTLANGFTYVEAYLARGMDIDDFAPNFSFFFSNGMDAEYTVLGRVARRIWAIAMRDRYGASERAQKLKYHVQTSGRSLHAQEMDFNDIRTSLQALCAIYDNTNSLHTNAYDEAVTTPTESSVRRALAIQMIIDQEWGLAKNENPLQGAAIVDELTDLLEEAVLAEFDRISNRGGVLGAMETGYQRGRIQDESMLYEHRKHDGSLPIIGVNTFLRDDADGDPDVEVELARATVDEKRGQLERVRAFQDTHRDDGQAQLTRLQDAATSGGNVFEVLMDAVRVCSLGQITEALFEVGGQYRRNV